MGHVSVVTLLLERGADKDAKAILVRCVAPAPMPKRCSATQQHRSAHGDDDAWASVLDVGCSGPTSCRAGFSFRGSALPDAPHRRMRCVGCAQFGMTPLNLAAYNGHASVVAVLLERGADKETKDKARRVAPTAQCSGLCGRAFNEPSSCRCLLGNALSDVLRRRMRCVGCAQTGMTPLHSAAYNGHASVVTVLLERGADKEANLRKHTARFIATPPRRNATPPRRTALCDGAAVALARHRLQRAMLFGHVGMPRLDGAQHGGCCFGANCQSLRHRFTR
jgi:hypothetical protein